MSIILVVWGKLSFLSKRCTWECSSLEREMEKCGNWWRKALSCCEKREDWSSRWGWKVSMTLFNQLMWSEWNFDEVKVSKLFKVEIFFSKFTKFRDHQKCQSAFILNLNFSSEISVNWLITYTHQMSNLWLKYSCDLILMTSVKNRMKRSEHFNHQFKMRQIAANKAKKFKRKSLEWQYTHKRGAVFVLSIPSINIHNMKFEFFIHEGIFPFSISANSPSPTIEN